jgi:glycosyltransferase involved in cell wall biosynthesis
MIGEPMSTLPPAPELSVVVLCYRSGERARDFAREISQVLTQAGIASYELVLVANYLASRPGEPEDPTPGIVRELARTDPWIVASTVEKQGMMGWDLRSGLALARGRYLAMLDGDGQVLASDLVPAFAVLRAGGVDLVKATRVERDDGLARRALSFTYNLCFRLLFPGLPVRDINGKPKVLTRAAYERLDLRSDDWFIDAEMMIQARRLGFVVREVETVFLGLADRRSFVRPGAIFEFLKNLARARIAEKRRSRSGS